MTTLTTFSGQQVNLLYLQQSHVHMVDIAHALACQTRYAGHAARPYSEAEHALLALDIMERTMHVDVHGRLAALLHTAHLAYLGTVCDEVRTATCGAWDVVEGRAQRTVRSAFALHTCAHLWARQIAQAHLIARATERAHLLPPGGTPCPELLGVQPATWVSLMATERAAMTWRDWRDAFTAAYEALDYARNEALFPVIQH